MARTNQPDPPLAISTEELPHSVLLLRVHDAIDAMTSDALDRYLRTQISPQIRWVIVDLSAAATVSAAGVRVLANHSMTRAPSLLVVADTAPVRRLLKMTTVKGMLDIHSSMDSALAATADKVTRLTQEVFDLRAALRSRPLIARALGVLQGRYGLDLDASFGVMREGAQRHNLKLSTLASAVLAATPPDGPEWFPGRVRRPAPALCYITEKQDNRTAVLSAFLDAVLATMHTEAGDLQLVDPLTGALQIEQHRGLPAEFIDFFATLDNTETACAQALRRGARVVVTNVAADPIFAGTASGDVVLQAGVQSVQSTPLLLPDGRCVGMVSTHHTTPDLSPTAVQSTRLDKLARETALWLDWHQRTVVLDALEYLHREAQRLR